MAVHTKLLIVGAGPFGLSIAALARARQIEHVLCGRPMEFWQRNMPRGMLLRSACDWHLDPTGVDTMEAFLGERGQTPADVEPLTLDFYLEYAEWFRRRKAIEPLPSLVEELDRDGGSGLVAQLDDGSSIAADNVILAPGFKHFANIPADIAGTLPQASYSHTCDCVDLGALAGKRCLIVGGRQSAFEWAALLREAGAAAVHVSHRHPTPSFTESDWSWVGELLERIARDPAWIHDMPADERARLDKRFWVEGRLKLEPWLAPRLDHPQIEIMPETRITACQTGADAIEVSFDNGEKRAVDHVIFATGYKPDLSRLPYLADSLVGQIAVEDGFPKLDTGMQTTVPGLYVTSLPAARSFGLFFGFTSAVRASAQIVVRAIAGAGEPG